MQKLNPRIAFGRVDRDLIPDRGQLRGGVLPVGLQSDAHPLQLEFQRRQHPLGPFDHAGGQSGQQQFHRVQGVLAAFGVGRQTDFGPVHGGKAAGSVQPPGGDVVLHGILTRLTVGVWRTECPDRTTRVLIRRKARTL